MAKVTLRSKSINTCVVKQGVSCKRSLVALLAGLLVIFLFLGVSASILAKQAYQDTDFFAFWLTGRLLVQGGDPYSVSDWVQGHDAAGASCCKDPTFLYPLPLAAVFLPFGNLPIELAFISWVCLSLVMLSGSILLLLSLSDRTARSAYLFPVVAGFVFFRPVHALLWEGQLGSLFLFLAALATLSFQRKHWTLGGVFLAFLFLKPQIGFPVVTVVAAWFLITRRYSAFQGLAAGCGLLMAIGLLFDPKWVVRFIDIGTQKVGGTFGFSSSAWGIAAGACHHVPGCTLALGALLSFATLVIVFLIFWQAREGFAVLHMMGLAVAAGMFITPYTWPYDQVLLVLPTLATVSELARRAPYLLSASLPLAFALLSVVLLLPVAHLQREYWNGLLTLAAFTLLWAVWVHGRLKKDLLQV